MATDRATVRPLRRPLALPSLRRRLLWRVMVPLALTWLAGSAMALAVAAIYTRKAFDRSLLDDAFALAANVDFRAGQARFGLSDREVSQVLFDHDETVLFAIVRGDGSLLAGRSDVARWASFGSTPVGFDDHRLGGLDLRTVSLVRDAPLRFAVVVAQTKRSRAALAGQLLVAAVIPQLVLLLLLGLWLRRSVRDELQPLGRLEQLLAQRDTNDLRPVQLNPGTRDIAHLADAVNALLARIGAAFEVQREFAGDVAHQLRTPLAGIRSLAEYGLSQRDPAVWKEQLRRIAASEERASHLVDQLLALALAYEVGEGLSLQAIAIDAVVRDLIVRMLLRADALGVDLGAEGLEQPLRVLGTPALLDGLLTNLVDNALRYGRPPEGGIVPRVTISAEVQGAEICLSVTDNGPGMDALQRARVLARWEQGAAGMAQGSGTGLGLAIVVRYVSLLGGRLELGVSPEGQGLRVSVWLLRPPG